MFVVVKLLVLVLPKKSCSNYPLGFFLASIGVRFPLDPGSYNKTSYCKAIVESRLRNLGGTINLLSLETVKWHFWFPYPVLFNKFSFRVYYVPQIHCQRYGSSALEIGSHFFCISIHTYSQSFMHCVETSVVQLISYILYKLVSVSFIWELFNGRCNVLFLSTVWIETCIK